jgi:hypothetical protein
MSMSILASTCLHTHETAGVQTHTHRGPTSFFDLYVMFGARLLHP